MWFSYDGPTLPWPPIHLKEDTFVERVFNIRRRKVGGIWFLRVGRLQFSFCLCRSFARPYKGGRTVEVCRDR